MPQQTKKAVVDNRGLRNPRHDADQGRDCGAAENRRITKNIPRRRDIRNCKLPTKAAEISNKLLGSSTVKFPFPLASMRNARLRGLGCSQCDISLRCPG